MTDQKNLRILPTLLKSELLNKLKERKANAFIRQGSFSDEIIWGERKFVFPTKKKKVASGIWIFRSVLNDVREYVSENKISVSHRGNCIRISPYLYNTTDEIETLFSLILKETV
jgi:selenocysteine lyase/cysteine desulfurase